MAEVSIKNITTNRKAFHDYFVEERIECGIELKGTEVKSIRQAKVNLKDGFAMIKDSEVFLKNVYIAPFEKGNINNVPEFRDRKLLLHKAEIAKILGKVSQGGYTLVPYKMGFVNQYVKVELALCKGKKLYDKRETIKQREAKRRIEQAMKV